MDEIISFGGWVRRRRKGLDLTQAELAHLACCAEATIRKIEAGERRPSRQLVEFLAEALQVPSSDRALFLLVARGERPLARLPAPVSLGHARSQAPPTPARVPATPLAGNLPAPTTRLIGRRRELDLLCGLLADPGRRLVTLTGPGGGGKTRLALALAATIASAYQDGVWLVELAALTDPALVAQAVATALDVREMPGQPLTETLIAHTRSRQLLLVLDNCEHLIEVCAQLAETLLRRCPHLRLLVTSREPLSISAEIIWPVPPLAMPDPHWSASPGELMRCEAVELFVDRAQAVLPTFQLSEQNASAVVEICARLDGLPLAIELAAARVPALGVRQIAGRLGDSLQLLTTGGRTALTRQRTLRATLDWSYALLPERERALFRRLAVFAGGFTLEAAETIGTDEEHVQQRGEVLDALTRLVAQSLVEVGENGPATRYRLLETVRQYAEERLCEAGERARIGRRHLAYHLALAEEAEPHLMSTQRSEWLRRLTTEHDNLRAALAWAQHDDEAATSGLLLAGILLWYWNLEGLISEGRGWLERWLACRTQLETSERARALHAAGELARFQADTDIARQRLEDALLLARRLGDTTCAARALADLGLLALSQGNLVAARAHCEESVAIFRQLGNEWELALALHCLGDVRIADDSSAAVGLHDESLALFRKLGDRWGMALPLTSLGRLALYRGEYATAQAYLAEGLALRRQEPGKKWLIAISLNSLGEVARCQEDYERARELFEEGLVLAHEFGGKGTISWALHNLGMVALALGDTSQAAAYLTEALAMERDAKSQPGLARSLTGLAGLALANQQLERAAHLLAAADSLLHAMGAQLEPADRRAYEQFATDARTRLSADEFAAAWSAGYALPLEEAPAED